jgi:hypothetical protein
MSERSLSSISRTLLRVLSALLTICLLVQFFIAGMAAMTDPQWWTYHSAWVAIFQWLVVLLPIAAWMGGSPRGRRTMFACVPLAQVALQYVLAHRGLDGRLSIGIGLHAVNAALFLIVAVFLTTGFPDRRVVSY